MKNILLRTIVFFSLTSTLFAQENSASPTLGASLAANQPSNPIAQGSTTGITGTPIMGIVTTSTPSGYNNNQVNFFSLTTNGALRVDGSGVTQPVSGTFWQSTQPVSLTSLPAFASTPTVNSAESGTWNITNISGTISLPTGAALSSLQPDVVHNGSITLGSSGTTMLAAVTTAAPSYSNNQTYFLNMNTSGGLRVDGSGVTQPVSGTFWQATQPVSGTFWQATQPVSIATLPTLAAGTNTIGNVINAPTSLSSLAVSHGSTTTLTTSLVGKASAGNLYSYHCTAITGTAAGYCIAYNGTAAPGTGALTGANVLDVCYFNTPAGCSLSHGIIPANYSTGIVILISSAVTPFTYTTGTDTGYISADYN